jgi:hypothetical protein
MRELDEAGCFIANSPAAMEVRKIWQARESLAPDAAGRDPVIQAFMANCLVESIRSGGPLGPAEASAVAFLKQALKEPNRGLAGIAMAGLSGVLVKEDVVTIVSLGSGQPTLAIPAIAALGMSCVPEAKAGVTSIRAAYAGTQQAVEIDRFMADTKELPAHCGRDGRASSNAFVGKVVVPPDRSPDATQMNAALENLKGPKALQTLLDLQCTADHADAVEEMRKAWQRHGSLGMVVQAVIAKCLIEADVVGSPRQSEVGEAAVVLRRAIHDADAMSVLMAVKGLALVGADEDIAEIAEVPRRIPGSLNAVVRALGYACGASNLNTIALMREQAGTGPIREQIDTVYQRIEPVREQKCGKGK